MPSLKLNGVDTLTLGLRLQGIPGGDNMPSRQVVTVNAPGLFGGYAVRTDPGGPRRLALELALVRNSVANRIASAKTVKALCESGLVRIELDHGTGIPIQVIDGVLDGEPVVELPRRFRSPVALLKIVFLCLNPLWRAPAGRSVALAAAATRYPLQVGTGPNPLIVRVMGAATTPVFAIRDAWGNPRHAFTLPTLLSTDWLDIDTRRGMIEKVTSGVRTNVLSISTITGDFPFSIDPSYGDYANSLWATAEVSAGTGEVLYTETFL